MAEGGDQPSGSCRRLSVKGSTTRPTGCAETRNLEIPGAYSGSTSASNSFPQTRFSVLPQKFRLTTPRTSSPARSQRARSYCACGRPSNPATSALTFSAQSSPDVPRTSLNRYCPPPNQNLFLEPNVSTSSRALG